MNEMRGQTVSFAINRGEPQLAQIAAHEEKQEVLSS